MRRRAIIAVLGGGQGVVAAGSPAYALAQEVGRLIARRGGILLCGGGSGVMEAAARGAQAAGGFTVGVMKEAQGAPKAHLSLMLRTGLGEGRNWVNAAAADALIALQGETGTLSEIALALKIERPVVCLRAWEFLQQAGFAIRPHTEPERAVAEAFDAAEADAAGLVEAAIRFPPVPDQSARYREFVAAVEAWSDGAARR